MDGKLRVVMVEVEGGSDAIQGALRAFAPLMQNGATDAPKLELVAPPALPAPPLTAVKRGPRVETKCFPKAAAVAAAPETGAPKLKDFCVEAVKARAMTSAEVFQWVTVKHKVSTTVGSVYQTLAKLKQKGVIENREDVDSTRKWFMAA